MENRLYIATANRACSLLYSYIKEHADKLWLLPVNVCPDVPLTFCLAKVAFKFIDIDSDTLCIDLDSVEKILLQSPSGSVGLLYVRTYGVLKDTSEDFERLKLVNKGIVIVDDRCLCVPERMPKFWNADMLLYSTGHCKQIDLSGGGLAFYQKETNYIIDLNLLYNGTDEEEIYKKAYSSGEPLSFIPQGWLKMNNYISSDEYFQAIERVIPERNERRASINSIYFQELPDSIQLDSDFQQWRFNIRVSPQLKATILSELFSHGLFASNHYHSANKLFDYDRYPVSDSLYDSVINLFNDKYFTKDKAIKTCNIINMVMKNSKFTPPHIWLIISRSFLCEPLLTNNNFNEVERRAA